MEHLGITVVLLLEDRVLPIIASSYYLVDVTVDAVLVQWLLVSFVHS